MQSLLGELVDSIVSFPGEFQDVAAGDPISAILLLFGIVFVGVSSAVLGYLTLGALVDLVMPDVSGQSPPQAGR